MGQNSNTRHQIRGGTSTEDMSSVCVCVSVLFSQTGRKISVLCRQGNQCYQEKVRWMNKTFSCQVFKQYVNHVDCCYRGCEIFKQKEKRKKELTQRELLFNNMYLVEWESGREPAIDVRGHGRKKGWKMYDTKRQKETPGHTVWAPSEQHLHTSVLRPKLSSETRVILARSHVHLLKSHCSRYWQPNDLERPAEWVVCASFFFFFSHPQTLALLFLIIVTGGVCVISWIKERERKRKEQSEEISQSHKPSEGNKSNLTLTLHLCALNIDTLSIHTCVMGNVVKRGNMDYPDCLHTTKKDGKQSCHI